jgi:hypothetical protein
MLSIYDSASLQNALASGALTNGAHNGLAVDTGLFGNNFRSLQFVITAGTITDGNHTVTAQECTTSGGTYTPVDTTRLQGVPLVLLPANSGNLFAIGVHHTLRFVQLVITTAGATTGGVFSAVCICGSATKGPVARA